MFPKVEIYYLSSCLQTKLRKIIYWQRSFQACQLLIIIYDYLLARSLFFPNFFPRLDFVWVASWRCWWWWKSSGAACVGFPGCTQAGAGAGAAWKPTITDEWSWVYHERGRSQVRATSVTCDPKGPAQAFVFLRKLHSDSGYWLCRSITPAFYKPGFVLSVRRPVVELDLYYRSDFRLFPVFHVFASTNRVNADVVMIQTMSVCTISASASSLCKCLRISYYKFSKRILPL